MDEKEDKKEVCILCRKDLPYGEYVDVKRNDNGTISGLEKKVKLKTNKCTEVEIELSLFTPMADFENPLVTGLPIFPSRRTYVHKKCAGSYIVNSQGEKMNKKFESFSWRSFPCDDLVLKITKVEGDLEEKVTHQYIYVCDQGQYGSISCGHCGESLNEKKEYNQCPKCDYTFKGTKSNVDHLNRS